MMTEAEVHAGLNGWHRYGQWSAHYFVNGKQQCHTAHGNFDGLKLPPKRPEVAVLSKHGQPFGRVCSRRLKVSRTLVKRSTGKP